MTRDEAAESVGISRKLAAFHLDKLVDAGLLSAHYAHPGGLRRVGRTPKVYEPSDLELKINIPPRDHAFLADILLEAISAETPAEDARHAALRVAAERGRHLGHAERTGLRGARVSPERALTCAQQVLEQHGFEPFRETPTLMRLRNCPFHPLSAKAPALVCELNHAFLTGFLEGLNAPRVAATLTPTPGHCCVELGLPTAPSAPATPTCNRDTP